MLDNELGCIQINLNLSH